MASKQDQERRTFSSAKARAEKRESGGSRAVKIPQGVKRFQPKEGAMYLDIISYVVGKGNPQADEGTCHFERTFYLHRNIGPNQEAYVCLSRTLNEPCPVCEFRQRMQRDPEIDEELVREMAPKERQLFNVIDTKNREAGIQIWDVSYHLFGKMLDERVSTAEEDEKALWDKFHHPRKGSTLRVVFKKEKMGKNEFLAVSSIDLRPRAEPYEMSILDEAHVLDDLLQIEDYDTLKKLLSQTAKPEEDDDDATPPKKKAAAPSDDDDDDDDAPPAKKKAAAPADDDDDDDDATPPPKKKAAPPADDDDDDDATPPTKKKAAAPADDDDDDAPPAKKKPARPDPDADDDDDDDEPAPKKKSAAPADDDDDDVPPPKKKAAPPADDDDWGDEPAPKKSGKKAAAAEADDE